MGFFDRFKRKPATTATPLNGPHPLSVPRPPVTTSPTASAKPQRPAPSIRPQATWAGGPRFVVIDVETTGLTATCHRVIELAIVTTDPQGMVLDEWTTRLNPEGPVGATHIHGITDADVAHAPRFIDLITEINRRLTGGAVVAHNSRFDLAFLRAEYARAGWRLPRVPALCTLEASAHHLPHLERRRLMDCCWAIGHPLTNAHSALGDARATSALLAVYMDPHRGVSPREVDLKLLVEASTVVWPSAASGPPASGATPMIRMHHDRAVTNIAKAMTPAASSQQLVQLVERFSLVDALDEGAPDGSIAYLEKLAEVMEDGVLTSQEANDLTEVAQVHDLDADGRAAAHKAFVLALAHEALTDGKVSRAERTELMGVATVLDVAAKVVPAVLEQAEIARHARLSADLQPLPADWPHGEPLRVGHKVVFTGCEGAGRDHLERESERLGVRVLNKVSAATAMLVSDYTMDGGKAADAHRLGTRIVDPATYGTLLQHLQPATPRTRARATTPTGMGPAVAPGADPTAVRAWARSNGFEVGVRGRLPAPVLAAYIEAHPVGAS